MSDRKVRQVRQVILQQFPVRLARLAFKAMLDRKVRQDLRGMPPRFLVRLVRLVRQEIRVRQVRRLMFPVQRAV